MITSANELTTHPASVPESYNNSSIAPIDIFNPESTHANRVLHPPTKMKSRSVINPKMPKGVEHRTILLHAIFNHRVINSKMRSRNTGRQSNAIRKTSLAISTSATHCRVRGRQMRRPLNSEPRSQSIRRTRSLSTQSPGFGP